MDFVDRCDVRPRVSRFYADLIALRKAHPVFRRPHYFKGTAHAETGLKDITWINMAGHEMTNDDWHNGGLRAFAAMLGGDTGDRFISLRGYPELDETFLFLMNAHDHEVAFTLPSLPSFHGWKLLIDTTRPEQRPPDSRFLPNATLAMRPRTLALLVAE